MFVKKYLLGINEIRIFEFQNEILFNIVNKLQMGYHIINLINNKLKHDYADSFNELCYFDCINENSVIYEGDESWIPLRVGDTNKYKVLSKGWYRAGIQAQEIFKQQATEHGFILEELNQDQKSFKSYVSNSNSISIKRGDFLIRNMGNIEIDVKCRSFYKLKNGEYYFDFKCLDVEKHINMTTFTKTPIIIAVYENKNNHPIDSVVYMFDVSELIQSVGIKKYYREGIGECFMVPILFTHKGFSFIKQVNDKQANQNHIKPKAYTIEEKRLVDKNAYKKWTKEEDELLEALYCQGKSVKALAKYLGRNNGAIRSRINKLELEKKYNNIS